METTNKPVLRISFISQHGNDYAVLSNRKPTRIEVTTDRELNAETAKYFADKFISDTQKGMYCHIVSAVWENRAGASYVCELSTGKLKISDYLKLV